jgi:hypothetical protein
MFAAVTPELTAAQRLAQFVALPPSVQAAAGRASDAAGADRPGAAVSTMAPTKRPSCGGGASAHHGGFCFGVEDQLRKEDRLRDADAAATAEAGATVQALAASRVDLLKLIRDGIKSREFIAGSGGTLARGKRHHVPAGAKAGKSLAFGVVTAVDRILAGATVTVLDRENGADEYARRLQCVLDARDATSDTREQISAGYRYHEWPTLKLEHGREPTYAEAFAGADVVIFDSSRKSSPPPPSRKTTATISRCSPRR